jgi:hypothetical protein
MTSRYALLADFELARWPAPPEVVAEVLAEECRDLIQRPPIRTSADERDS